MMQGIEVTLPELLKLREFAGAIDLLNHRRVKSDRFGGYLSHLKGRGIDFEETRAYQPGDDIRMMDWRVTARTGHPHTKVFRQERERPVFIVTDFSQSMFFGTRVAFKSYLAAKIAAVIAWSANLLGDRIGGIFFTEQNHIELKPKGRAAGIFPVLRTLCDMTKIKPQTGQQTLADALLRLRRVAKPGSCVIVISDFQNMDKNTVSHLMMLAAHCEMMAIQLYDVLERELPKPNQYGISDGQVMSVMNTFDRQFCMQYHTQVQEKQNFIKQVFRQCQVPLIEIGTQDDWMNILMKYLSGVGK